MCGSYMQIEELSADQKINRRFKNYLQIKELFTIKD